MDQPFSNDTSFDALPDAGESLRVILNTIVDGVIITDDRGVIYSANPAVERMFGFHASELIGKNVSMLMPTPHAEGHDGYLEKYLKTGHARIIGIGRRVEGKRKNGTTVPIDLSISEVQLRDRRMFAGVMRDMTERQRAEEAFQREHAFLESLIETAHAVILVLDKNGRIVRYNRFTEELTGFPLSEVVGQDWFEHFLTERDRSSIRMLFQQCLSGRPIQGHVNPILTRDGDEKTIAWSARVLSDAQNNITGVLSIGNDVTELHHAEQRLLQAERLAAIGQMMAGLAHESRNSLQRAHACLEMLELDVQEQQSQFDLTQRVKKALDELHRLYDEVRNYAAPLNLERRRCRISELIEETWDHLKTSVDGRQIHFELSIGPQADHFDVDPLRVQQVFRNIFENAISACAQRDDGAITVTTMHANFNGEPAVSIVVRDNGPGLTPEQAKNIFEPFYTTKTKGTGLGMPIAKRIIEAHGGQIQIGKTALAGAEIVIILPKGKSCQLIP